MATKQTTEAYEHGRWNGHRFIISPTLIRGFRELGIRSGSETEEKEKNEQKHVSRKRGNVTEVSVTIQLNAFTGCNVRKEAMEFIEEARLGKTGYFYIGNKKLVPFELMLTNATVQQIQISPHGDWLAADIPLTFQQYATGGTSVSGSDSSSGSSGSSGGGGGGGYSGGGSSYSGSSSGSGSTKASVRETSPVTTKKTPDDLPKSPIYTATGGSMLGYPEVLKQNADSVLNQSPWKQITKQALASEKANLPAATKPALVTKTTTSPAGGKWVAMTK